MTDSELFRDPVAITTPGWQVLVAVDEAPPSYDQYTSHAELVEEIDLDGDGRFFFAAVSAPGAVWPSLVIAMRFSPSVGGFRPSVAVTQDCVFVGAGSTASCYSRSTTWRRVWVEQIEFGFLGWAIHDAVVVLSGELTLGAWDVAGNKLWTTFVEPPWGYQVHDGQVDLDVMGKLSTFGLTEGPPEHG